MGTAEERELLRALESVAYNTFVFPDENQAALFRKAKVKGGSKYKRGFPTIYTVKDRTRLLGNGIAGGRGNSLTDQRHLTVKLSPVGSACRS